VNSPIVISPHTTAFLLQCLLSPGRLSLLPFVGWLHEYQPKGSDALWLGSKRRYGLFADNTACCHTQVLWKML